MALALSAGSVACKQTEQQKASLNGKGPDSTSQKVNALWLETHRHTSTIFLETETMVRCSKKTRTKRRIIAIALCREYKQVTLAIADLMQEKVNESCFCGFGALRA